MVVEISLILYQNLLFAFDNWVALKRAVFMSFTTFTWMKCTW